MNRILCYGLSVVLALGAAVVSAQEESATSEALQLTPKKTTTLLDRDGDRYQIQLQVPGRDGDSRRDEVVVMVDGSYSGDEEWPDMRAAILEIGKAVLDGEGNTTLTLMAFGMGDNIVLSNVADMEELEATMPSLPGGLLYGRSSTNCEAGFTGVAEYIDANPEIRAAHVIYITDGRINTDETPRDFYDWKKNSTRFGALTVAKAALEGAIVYGENLPPAFFEVFGDKAVSTDEEISAFFAELTDEQAYAFADAVWADVYESAGLTPGELYPVSDAERAFVAYDKNNGYYVQDAFYYSTYGSQYVKYPNCWTRTPQAATELAAHERVAALHMIDTDAASAWMNPATSDDSSKNVVGDNVTFTPVSSVANLTAEIDAVLTDLSTVPFSDVVVTDYMSKWVTLDQDTLSVVDVTADKVVWNAVDGWTDGAVVLPEGIEGRPAPVVVELVDPADYANGGEEVVGNTSGDIYKLTWTVKQGPMGRADNFRLQYEVVVDSAEKGFQYGAQHPANGATYVEYVDEKGETQTETIVVPTVDAECKDYVVDLTFDAGSASHICYLRVDADGNVEYLSKTDFADDDTGATIYVESGWVAAVFIKQSQSGMLWTSEDVDEETTAKLLEVVAQSDKAYKGCDAIVSGAGDHELEYGVGKKGKTKAVYYTFQ